MRLWNISTNFQDGDDGLPEIWFLLSQLCALWNFEVIQVISWTDSVRWNFLFFKQASQPSNLWNLPSFFVDWISSQKP